MERCDRYVELLSARLDGELTPEEDRDLSDHLSHCPACRALAEQLSALQTAFPALEEVPAPEGFAQGVMDRVRTSERKTKVVPLFHRPQLRGLAGLAACALVCVGLYRGGVAQKPELATLSAADASVATEEFMMKSAACPQGEEDVVTYSAEPTDGMELTTTGATPAQMEEDQEEATVLALPALPEGSWELIPPETAVSYDMEKGQERYHVTREVLDQVMALAEEAGMACSLTEGEENGPCMIVIMG